jgi:16S rRNA C967 or C1407 C5-methylase (RsmB/RsmF family)
MKRRTARRERHRGDTVATSPDNRRGGGGFHDYYRSLFGERWGTLQVALEREGPRIAWSFNDDAGPVPYYLDPASVAVAHLLPLGERNLDLCAAPGGKTLVLARRLAEARVVSGPDTTERDQDRYDKTGTSHVSLVANERSRERRARLRRVLEDHLPEEVRAFIRITGYDATRWGLHEPDHYDAILADVPCSSERHVLAAPRELDRWSDTRVRRLALQQFSILAAAIDSLRPGGHVLYSTCALTPEENDAVIRRALTRRESKVKLVTPDALQHSAAIISGAEATEFGLRIMPDRCEGAGPLYCALLQRKAAR